VLLKMRLFPAFRV